MAAKRSYISFLTKNQGMPMVAVGWVVVITSGITSFVLAKRHIDRLRMEKIRRETKLKLENDT
ncbi:Hypothetical predicted protein [Paramuricea clavata]|uniref:Uncharacterized protein n=1 Tax=Paramuricea clavata TaxID=317549 RepID=A0A7D9HW39_PARCT|nr:Hypothetical predicted protein [Paramuricea clavata]